MRRAAVTNLDLAGVDWKGRTLGSVAGIALQL
jgi:hypothetical protein